VVSQTESMTNLVVSFKPNWVNGWWLRAFTDPYAEVDGAVTKCSWPRLTTIVTAPGVHHVRTFVRYRRLIPGDAGSGETTVDLASGEDLRIISSNGITNQSPFVPRATG